MILVDGIRVETEKHFPDGTLAFKAPTPKEHFVCITWHYENDSELFALMCLRNHYADKEVFLDIPYLPNARMDRVKNKEDIFTLKTFCSIINSLNFTSVQVLDAHSNVSVALLNNVTNNFPYEPIGNAICSVKDKHSYQDFLMFYPDEGAMKRYSEKFHQPYAFGIKKRNWEDGKILGLDIVNKELVNGANILIVDDICSKGTTFYYSALALKEAGAKSISLYITHCENTILEGEIFKCGLIDNVYTTNSLVHCDELKEKLIYV